MKTFWQKNKLLIAIFVFFVATTSYLFTTSYTNKNLKTFPDELDNTTRPSKISAQYGGSEDRSIDKYIQNEVQKDTKTSAKSTSEETKHGTTSQKIREETTLQKTQIDVTIEIYSKGYDENHIRVPEGSSVYDAMKQLDIPFDGHDFGSLGFFVESIGEIKNDKLRGRYWMYYINGQKAKIGISNYIIKPHDIITWKYEDEEK